MKNNLNNLIDAKIYKRLVFALYYKCYFDFSF